MDKKDYVQALARIYHQVYLDRAAEHGVLITPWEDLPNEKMIACLDTMEEFLQQSSMINQQVVQDAINRIADEADKKKHNEALEILMD